MGISLELIWKINRYALRLVNKPVINDYIIGTGIEVFDKLYDEGHEFVQAMIYDRTVQEHKSMDIYLTPDKWEALREAIDAYNKALAEAQMRAVEVAKMIDHVDERTYYYNNRVGQDIGLCISYAGIRSRHEDNYYDDRTVNCSICGDGGCWHCEPWRFIDMR